MSVWVSSVDFEDREHRPRSTRTVVLHLVLSVLALAGLFLFVPAGAAKAAPYDEWAASPVEPSPSRVYLTGDSIIYWTAPHIKAARPGWHVEGVPGRQVQSLAVQIEQILAADPNPRLVIVELGTNTAGWEDYEALLRTALAPVPDGTRVMLVAPYRDPVKFGRGTGWADNLLAYHQYQVARAMSRIAEADGTCVARWRSRVSRHPELLHDGIHPTVAGRRALTLLLTTTARECS